MLIKCVLFIFVVVPGLRLLQIFCVLAFRLLLLLLLRLLLLALLSYLETA